MILYSASCDFFVDAQHLHRSHLYSSISDWVEISQEHAEMYYWKTTPIPFGYHRKANSLELVLCDDLILLEQIREAKNKEINAWRIALENDETQVVLALGSEWDAGHSARLRIDSTLLTAHMPPYWTDANNVDHDGMTLEELKQVKIAISELGFAIHDRQRTMKKEVEALTDVDEILNYPVGWPQS